MKVRQYRTHQPAASGGFVARNPNMCYLVTAEGEGRRSALIDASVDADTVARDLAEDNSTLEYILLTHDHSDHTFARRELAARFPGVSIGIHKASARGLSAGELPLDNGAVIRLGDGALSVMHTPGHTFDSVCFWNREEGLIFTGDTLFGGGIGCCDYSAGGNRNIFYQTILHLLGRLAPDTRIYPGHFSEHYQTTPPYDLATEKVKNPYVVNALAGRRGAFDRDLKEFSIEFETDDFVMMDASAIDSICALEREIWIPELQASRETILARLENGHKILGLKRHGELAGMTGWCYSGFSVEEGPDNFPRRFSDFSTCRLCDLREARSAFLYSVGIRAGSRQSGSGSLLLQGFFEKIREEGIRQVFVDSRLPSYRGSQADAHESIPPIPGFRDAVDRYLASRRLPSEGEFALDPRVRFYMTNGFRPWAILRDFIPDAPSDNMRVICYLNLEQDEPGADLPEA